jgi:hypothetical protein
VVNYERSEPSFADEPEPEDGQTHELEPEAGRADGLELEDGRTVTEHLPVVPFNSRSSGEEPPAHAYTRWLPDEGDSWWQSRLEQLSRLSRLQLLLGSAVAVLLIVAVVLLLHPRRVPSDAIVGPNQPTLNRLEDDGDGAQPGSGAAHNRAGMDGAGKAGKVVPSKRPAKVRPKPKSKSKAPHGANDPGSAPTK